MTASDFVFEYFKADQEAGPGSYEKMYSIIQTLNWDEIKPIVLKLKYFYFLKTSYWHIISEEVKRRANRTCVCGCRENLQVHHMEEGDKHHGEEHILLVNGVRGLVCLCSKCHGDKHDVSIKKFEKSRQRSDRKEKMMSQLPTYPFQISEEQLSGSSITLIRKLLEELEHDNRVVIDRNIYEGWLVRRT